MAQNRDAKFEFGKFASFHTKLDVNNFASLEIARGRKILRAFVNPFNFSNFVFVAIRKKKHLNTGHPVNTHKPGYIKDKHQFETDLHASQAIVGTGSLNSPQNKFIILYFC